MIANARISELPWIDGGGFQVRQPAVEDWLSYRIGMEEDEAAEWLREHENDGDPDAAENGAL